MSAAILALWICCGRALAITLPETGVVAMTGTYAPTEDAAAAALIGYRPDPNATLPIFTHQGEKVTVLRAVPPHEWFPKYAAMRAAARARGVAQASSPDDSDMAWLVEVERSDHSKVWTTSGVISAPGLPAP